MCIAATRRHTVECDSFIFLFYLFVRFQPTSAVSNFKTPRKYKMYLWGDPSGIQYKENPSCRSIIDSIFEIWSCHTLCTGPNLEGSGICENCFKIWFLCEVVQERHVGKYAFEGCLGDDVESLSIANKVRLLYKSAKTCMMWFKVFGSSSNFVANKVQAMAVLHTSYSESERW